MEKTTLLLLLLILFSSCNRKYSSSNFSTNKFHNKKIAILPFQIHTTIKELPEGITMEMIDESEKRKSKTMQLDLFRYLLRAYAKSSRKVILQHYHETNRILKQKGVAYDEMFKLTKRELAKILKVDAIVYGNIYQNKRRLHLDEKALLKNDGQNSISSVIYVYGKSKRERIQWKDDRGESGFPSEYGPEVIKGLLRKAAANFPF